MILLIAPQLVNFKNPDSPHKPFASSYGRFPIMKPNLSHWAPSTLSSVICINIYSLSSVICIKPYLIYNP